MNIEEALRALRWADGEKREAALALRAAGWCPHRAGDGVADIVIGFAGHRARYCIYPPPPRPLRAEQRGVYLLSDRARETAVFAQSDGGVPTPRQAAATLRKHGVPSLETTPEESRRGQPRVPIEDDT